MVEMKSTAKHNYVTISGIADELCALATAGSLTKCADVIECLADFDELAIMGEVSYLLACINKALPIVKPLATSIDGNMSLSKSVLRLFQNWILKCPSEMLQYYTCWISFCFYAAVSYSDSIRCCSLKTLSLFQEQNKGHFIEMTPSLKELMKSMFIKRMLELWREKQEIYVLDLWMATVRLLGKTLHFQHKLMNDLMTVTASGFARKPFDGCQIQRHTFKCWAVLMENFALDARRFLTKESRIQLACAPLLECKSDLEEVVLEKLKTWSFLISCLDVGVIIESFEKICMPFIRCCTGGILEYVTCSSVDKSFRQQVGKVSLENEVPKLMVPNELSASDSPVISYSKSSLDILAQFLFKLFCGCNDLTDFSAEFLSSSILCNDAFVWQKYVDFLLQCLRLCDFQETTDERHRICTYCWAATFLALPKMLGQNTAAHTALRTNIYVQLVRYLEDCERSSDILTAMFKELEAQQNNADKTIDILRGLKECAQSMSSDGIPVNRAVKLLEMATANSDPDKSIASELYCETEKSQHENSDNVALESNTLPGELPSVAMSVLDFVKESELMQETDEFSLRLELDCDTQDDDVIPSSLPLSPPKASTIQQTVKTRKRRRSSTNKEKETSTKPTEKIVRPAKKAKLAEESDSDDEVPLSQLLQSKTSVPVEACAVSETIYPTETMEPLSDNNAAVFSVPETPPEAAIYVTSESVPAVFQEDAAAVISCENEFKQVDEVLLYNSPNPSPGGILKRRKEQLFSVAVSLPSPSSCLSKKHVSFAPLPVDGEATCVYAEETCTIETNVTPETPKNSNVSQSKASQSLLKPYSSATKLKNKLQFSSPVSPSTGRIMDSTRAHRACDLFSSPNSLSSNESILTPTRQLDDFEPVWPSLVHCKVKIEAVLPSLAGTWSSGLLNMLRGRKIFTIGDLCSYTEYQISKLPLKVPPVKTFKRAMALLEASLSTKEKTSASHSLNEKLNSINGTKPQCEEQPVDDALPEDPLPSADDALRQMEARETHSLESQPSLKLLQEESVASRLTPVKLLTQPSPAKISSNTVVSDSDVNEKAATYNIEMATSVTEIPEPAFEKIASTNTDVTTSGQETTEKHLTKAKRYVPETCNNQKALSTSANLEDETALESPGDEDQLRENLNVIKQHIMLACSGQNKVKALKGIMDIIRDVI